MRRDELLDTRSVFGEVRLSCFKIYPGMYVGTVSNLQNIFLVAVNNVFAL